jgi:outer membrane protein assembly factor BamB
MSGFDVATGHLLWTFHTTPQGEEPGVETWEKDSWKEAGNANVWAPMSADEELGYVYLPVSTPTNDYYGGHRPGDGLYGESLVCLDATTGNKIWHYQLVHHGLWDYDPPAAPNLIDITVDGKPIKAVAQATKQAFLYVFDRVTGKPVWPIEFGSIVAIDMNTGEHRWRVPVGRSIAMPSVLRVDPSSNFGLPNRSWALITKTVMIPVRARLNFSDLGSPQRRSASMGVRQVDRREARRDRTPVERKWRADDLHGWRQAIDRVSGWRRADPGRVDCGRALTPPTK